jgi:uncharacterized repeat protein (TIGR01451 family)
VTYVPKAGVTAPYVDVVTATLPGSTYMTSVAVQPALCEKAGAQLNCQQGRSFTGATGSGLLAVTSPGNWTVAGPSWLTLTTTRFANGNGEIAYSFSNQTSPVSGDIVIMGGTPSLLRYTISVASAISINRLPATRTKVADGDIVQLTATAATGVAIAWQQPTAGSLDTLSGTVVNFTAPLLSSGLSSVTVVATAGGQQDSLPIPLTKALCDTGAPDCPASITVSSGAGSGTVNVTKGGSWSLQADSAWVHVSPASLADNQSSVSYSFDANTTSTTRSANLSVVVNGVRFGDSLALVQPPPPAVSIVTPPRNPIGACESVNLAVAPSTLSVMSWQLSPSSGAGTIDNNGRYTAPCSLTSPGSVAVTAVTSNGTSAPLTLNYQPSVCQSATNCGTAMQIPGSAGTWSLTVTKDPAAGPWSAVLNAPAGSNALSISQSTASGDGTVNFTTRANPSTSPQSFSISFGGALAGSVSVTQAGGNPACPSTIPYLTPSTVLLPANQGVVFRVVPERLTGTETITWSVSGAQNLNISPDQPPLLATYQAPATITQNQTFTVSAHYINSACGMDNTMTATVQLSTTPFPASFTFGPPADPVLASAQTNMTVVTRTDPNVISIGQIDIEIAFSDPAATSEPILTAACDFKRLANGPVFLTADDPYNNPTATIGPDNFNFLNGVGILSNSQCTIWHSTQLAFQSDSLSYAPLIATFAPSFAGSKKVFGAVRDNTNTNIITPWTYLGTFTVRAADLTISANHSSAAFTQGQTGATYTLSISNFGMASSSGTVTVVDTLPPGLTAIAFSGTGWNCTLSTLTCTRSDALAANTSYPPITLTVNVAANAGTSVKNSATVSGGSEGNLTNDSVSDVTAVTPVADLTVTSTHSGVFTLGQSAATYTLTVSNPGAGPSSGVVTVQDSLPQGITATSIGGTGWNCAISTLSCTRNDALAAGSTYPPLTLTVSVAQTMPSSVSNSVTVSGGGELNTANDTATDGTTILSPPDLIITSSHAGAFAPSQVGALFALTVKNIGAQVTSGVVTVTDNLPAGLVATAIGGNGWTCSLSPATCTNANSLPPGASYPILTVTVTVTASAGSSITNAAVVSGGGESNASNDTSTDLTIVGGLRFIPVPPCRIADTRNSNGPFGGPQLGSGETRAFSIPSSPCGVPASALAYSLNLTVVPAGALGYVMLWPSGMPQPGTSTLNSLDGRVKSNAAIVPAGAGGGVSLFASNATHAVLDINGYFVAATDPNGLAFYPLAPCRVVDTRGTAGPLSGPSIAGGQSRTFPLPSATACNIPVMARAYSLNVTAVPSGALGYLTAWPTGQSQPGTTTLSATTGVVTGNAALVAAGTSGSIDLFASNTTDVVIDINGYFAPTGTGGQSLYTILPCRVLDTRQPAGSVPFSGTLGIQVGGTACNAPSAASSYVLSVDVVPPGPLGYLTLWPQGQSQPGVATLNALDGAITSNLAIVTGSAGFVNAFASNPTQLIVDVLGYFAQ